MSLVKLAGRNAKKQRSKIASRIQRKLDDGGRWGDLTNGEIHTYDKAMSRLHGKEGRIKKGKETKSYVNWAKSTREDPYTGKVGSTGAHSEEYLKKNPKAGKKNGFKKMLNSNNTKKTRPKLGLKGTLGMGAASLAMLGLAKKLEED